MNIELIKLAPEVIKHLPPKVLIGAGILIGGYLLLNGVLGVKAIGNSQGFENDILHIRITPIGQQNKVHTSKPYSAEWTEPIMGTVV